MTNSAVLFRVRLLKAHLLKKFRNLWYRIVRAPLGHLAWWAWKRFPTVDDRVLSRRNMIAQLPELTALTVSPHAVQRYVKDSDVQRKFFIWQGNWDLRSPSLNKHYRYRLMADIWHHRNNLRQSQTYQDLLSRIRKGEPVQRLNKGLHINTPQKALAFVEQQLELFDSLASQGVRPELAKDEINVAIGRNGEIIKANSGRKRLIAAQLLELDRVPVRIAYIHRDFIDRHLASSASQDQALMSALRNIRKCYGR